MRKLILIAMVILMMAGMAFARTCIDSDSTNDLHVVGNVTGVSDDGASFIFADRCLPYRGLILETFCDPITNSPSSMQAYCPGEETCEGERCGIFVYPRCSDNDPTNDVHVRGTVSVIRDAYSGTDYPDRCDTASPQVLEEYCTEDRGHTFERKSCPAGETCSEGVCVASATEMPCSDSDGQNAYTLGETWGIENYTTGGTPATALTPYQQFNDMCSAALRPGPTTGVPYIVTEAYCEGNRIKYRGINCLETETCEGGICVPLPASTRTGSCADVTCSADQVCRAGVCISRESDASERRVERVKTKINSVGVKAAALATKACGKTSAFTQISGKADVDKATKATKSINDLLVKAAGCKKVTLKAVPASTGKLGAAAAFSTLTQNAKDWVKKIKK